MDVLAATFAQLRALGVVALVAAGSIGQRVGATAYAELALEEVCLVIDGVFLGEVAKNAPLAA